jgi:hypothetical protein
MDLDHIAHRPPKKEKILFEHEREELRRKRRRDKAKKNK